jgi:predicted ribonuclease YlaK
MDRAECFLDTNVLIHFKPLSDWDWSALTNSSLVVLTVPATVIRELDQQKELGKTRRLRKRAQDSLRRLREWVQDGSSSQIHEGV